MVEHSALSQAELRSLIRKQEILFAGNRKLKIYGLFSCTSGNRLKVQNRVFFNTENEAIQHGYRPCGHCLRKKYLEWAK